MNFISRAEIHKTFQISTFKKIKQIKDKGREKIERGIGRDSKKEIKQFGKRRGCDVQEDI